MRIHVRRGDNVNTQYLDLATNLKEYDSKISEVGGYWFGAALGFAATAVLGDHTIAAVAAVLMFVIGLDDLRRWIRGY